MFKEYIENNSKNRKTFKYYDKISKNNKIKIVYYKDKVFNYSAINNYAVNYAKGEYILLLNNDIEIITKNNIDTTITHDIIRINESPTELIAETILLSEIGSIMAAVNLYNVAIIKILIIGTNTIAITIISPKELTAFFKSIE